MVIIRSGNTYGINFDLFSDTKYAANNVVGDLTYNTADLQLVNIIVSPSIGLQSILDPDKYLFGTVLPNKHYTVACEFRVLNEVQNLDITWSVTTSNNELNLGDNTITKNLVQELDGLLASEIGDLVLSSDKKTIIEVSPLSYVYGMVPSQAGDNIGDTAIMTFADSSLITFRWEAGAWVTYTASNWIETRLCLNTAPFAFSPVDAYNPTVAEVTSYLNTNYPSQIFLRTNGTQFSYFAPGGGTCTEPTHVFTLNEGTDQVALTYKKDKTHKHSLQAINYTGVELPLVSGTIQGDTETVSFLDATANYTWTGVIWNLDFYKPDGASEVIIASPTDSVSVIFNAATSTWELEVDTTLPVYNSRSAAFLALGANKKFRYGTINIDGVASPDDSELAIT